MLIASRLPEGWVLHDEHGRFIAVDGRITTTREKAYASTTLEGAKSLFDRICHPGWSLRATDWQYIPTLELNGQTALEGPLLHLFQHMCLSLGDNILIANIYNGIILSKQDIIDQLNIIAGNPKEERDATIRFRLDNKDFFRLYLKYLKAQLDSDPIEPSDLQNSHMACIINGPLGLINLDSIIRERVTLSNEAIRALAGHQLAPILGNRAHEQLVFMDMMAVFKRIVEYVSGFWEGI